LTSRWQISAGEITVWLTPLLFAFAALASAWVLHDARRRFPLYAVAAWTLATLVHAPVVLPLYLIARIFKPRPPADAPAPESTSTEQTDLAAADDRETAADDSEETAAGDSEETAAATPGAAHEETPNADGEPANDDVAASSPVTRAPFRLARYAPPLLYAFALLSAGAIYFYRDHHSFDAHLARAANARLMNRRDAAIREYRAALRLIDDAHTHKLLAVQLAEDGQTEAALAELRAAERGGEPDEHLPLRIAYALDALGRPAEAADEYRKFLRSGSCARPSPDERCAEAAARVR
jgi:tetratricopeptide (TPR) repeat protein